MDDEDYGNQEPSWWFQTNGRVLAFIALICGIGAAVGKLLS